MWYGVFDHGWYEFQLKYWWLFLVSEKFRCQILLQGISGGTNTVIYLVLTLEKLEKKSSLIQFHALPCNWNGFRPFKMVLRNKFLRKKEIIAKTWTLHKRKVHIIKKGRAYEFLDKRKVDVMDFLEQKNIFQRGKLVERWSFHSIYEVWIA